MIEQLEKLGLKITGYGTVDESGKPWFSCRHHVFTYNPDGKAEDISAFVHQYITQKNVKEALRPEPG